MVTTVGGLLIGIPAYFAYNYLSARIGSIVNSMEKSTLDFLDLLQEPLK
jgi:biopolymer transport protein ExbB